MCKKLVALQLDLLLVELPRWRWLGQPGGAMSRVYHLGSFAQACGFMAQVSIKAAGLQVVPRWASAGEQVELTLAASSGCALADDDLQLARYADELLDQLLRPVVTY